MKPLVLYPYTGMPSYRSVHRLTAIQAAYVAGLVDGEGTITLTRYHRNENRRLVVCISNNERPLLEFVCTLCLSTDTLLERGVTLSLN